MLTPDQYRERERHLEAARAERREKHQANMGVWPTPDDTGFGVTPIEIAPGRGDLSFTSGFVPTIPTALQMVGPYVVSFARLFMSQPYIGTAVMNLLKWGSRVPMHLYYRDDDDPNNKVRVKPNDHPLATALEAPWYRGSMMDLFSAQLGPVLVHGNSVIHVKNGAGNKIQFATKDWRFSRPVMPFRAEIDGFTFDYDNPEYKLSVPVGEVLHTKWWSPIWPIGCSPLQQLGVTLQIEDAAQRMQRASLANANRSSGVVSMDNEFLGMQRGTRDKITANLREDINSLHTSPENAGRPWILPPGLTWTPTQQTAVEAELIQQRKLDREEVAAVYNIPPPLMGILDHATYSNIDTQRDMLYTDVMGPPLVLCEQTMNAQVVREMLQDDSVYVEFDFGAVLRGNRLEQIAALRDAISMGMFNPNEGRSELGAPRVDVPGMDDFYLPLVNTLQRVGEPAMLVPALPTPQQPQRNGNTNGNGSHADRRFVVERAYRQKTFG